MKLKRSSRKLNIFLILFCVYAHFSYAHISQSETNALEVFGKSLNIIKNDYVEDVDISNALENAIKGMLSSLDPHSDYISKSDMHSIKAHTKGEFGGIGIEITKDSTSGMIKIISPIDESPAFNAGIKPKDMIKAINGKSVLNVPLEDSVKKMRGKTGEIISLTIVRNNDEFNVEMMRDVISVKSVKHDIKNDDIGYIRISTFNSKTSEDLSKSLREIKNKNISGLILDLRNNPGGLLDAAVKVSDIFIPRNLEIVSTQGKSSNSIKTYKSNNEYFFDSAPVVTLINGGSASASEIVAGALQDHKRAIIIGTKSFGKGSVQTILPLKDFGAIRITTSRYYTPFGRSIQAQGISPDITIEDKLLNSDASQYRESNLPGHLSNTQDINNSSQEKSSDNQLNAAIDLIKILNKMK